MPQEEGVRSRVVDGSKAGGGTFFTRASTKDQWVVDKARTGSQSFRGTQITKSAGHRWPPPRGRFNGDIGGGFSTVKQTAEFAPTSVLLLDGPPQLKKFTGSCTAPHPRISAKTSPTYPSGSLSPAGDLNALGAVAVAQSSPTNPVASATTFLAEMHREGLPSLPGIRTWENRTKALLGVAEDFLNYEFALSPLKREILSFANSASHSRTIIDQYKRDEGKLVRRKFRFPMSQSVEETVYKEGSRPTLGNGSFNVPDFNSSEPIGNTLRHRVVTRKTWFSGAFTYHIPSDNDYFGGLMDAGSEADKLFGTTLTPESIWELTPWSWAIDWFSNAQEVITNFQNIELYGLVLQYGYMMDETITKDTYTFEGGTGFKGVKSSNVAPVTLTTVTKHRVKANPFGFGIEWADLSPTQLAIAAALGITHVL